MTGLLSLVFIQHRGSNQICRKESENPVPGLSLQDRARRQTQRGILWQHLEQKLSLGTTQDVLALLQLKEDFTLTKRGPECHAAVSGF